ncbi:choline/carnitine O-acyltransferase [Nostoc sp. CHAB 5844]|nr:choline/carnitine O-acyltransferase [Nostoc sp. CHAB 5844]
MYQCQEHLPKLPLPKLENTCNQYIQMVTPLLSEPELARTKAAVIKFQQGVGVQLQKQLEMIDCWTTQTNYLHQEARYLEPRVSYLNERSTVVASPVLTTEKYQFTHIVAIIIFNALQFHLKIKYRQLEPDKDIFRRGSKAPLCMAQYDNLFGTIRVPEIRCDRFQKVKNSEHIVVIRQNIFYALKLLPEDKLPTVEAIAQQLDWILENTPSSNPPVGVLTGLPRTQWAVVRSYLKNLALENAHSLELLDSALFIVCLDEIMPPNIETLAKTAFTGDGGQNRWFDKPIQIVFNPAGQFAVTVEHSHIDGYLAARLIDEVNQEPNILQKPLVSSSFVELETPQQLGWELDHKLLEEVERASAFAQRLSNEIDIGVAIFDEFGSDFIEQHGLIADAMFILSLQIASTRLHGKVGTSILQVVHTRGFRYGRWDDAFAVTPQSLELIQSFNEQAPDEERYLAFKRAVNAHLRRVFDAKKGQGPIQHLHALYRLAHHQDSSLPDIFQDKIFNDFIIDPIIDVSTTGNRIGTELCCITPPRGYGIGYIIGRKRITFTVTTKHQKAEKFIYILKQCLLEVGELISKSPEKSTSM